MSALIAFGGVATSSDLIAASSVATVRGCARAGLIVPVGGGVYTLATLADPALGGTAPTRAWSRWTEGPSDEEIAVLTARHAIARGRSGALSLLCAAAHHGWPILREPTRVDIALPRSRHSRPDASKVRPYWVRDLSEEERYEHVTSPLRTVIECARLLPFDDALAVADSALRSGAVGEMELREAGETFRGAGASRVRRVAHHADASAANPFESALRAVHVDLPGLSLTTQFSVGDGLSARTDLADEELRIVLEADSYAFHGDRDLFEQTQRRHVELAGRDWVVLPYGFSVVTEQPTWVRAATEAVVHVRRSRGYGPGAGRA